MVTVIERTAAAADRTTRRRPHTTGRLRELLGMTPQGGIHGLARRLQRRSGGIAAAGTMQPRHTGRGISQRPRPRYLRRQQPPPSQTGNIAQHRRIDSEDGHHLFMVKRPAPLLQQQNIADATSSTCIRLYAVCGYGANRRSNPSWRVAI